MRHEEIKVFCIAQTRINEDQMRGWLDHLGAKDTPVPRTEGGLSTNEEGWAEEVEKDTTDAGALCGMCGKRCYMSFQVGMNPNVTRIRQAWDEYLKNILKSRHGSVLEHATWTFAIEGCSRVFTAEINRHRAGAAISEGSMRYIRLDDVPYWVPESIKHNNLSLMPKVKGKELWSREEFEAKKAITRSMFDSCFSIAEDVYVALCELWEIETLKDFGVKKRLTSMFRRIIPIGVSTGGTWTWNARALRHIIALRTAPGVEEEAIHVISKIGKMMFEGEPELFGDFSYDEETGAWVPEAPKV